MKKYICIILYLSLLLALVGCAGDVNNKREYVPPEMIRQIINAAERGEYSEKPLVQMIDGFCPNFERHIDDCTDVIKAEYIETYQIPREDYLHEFKVIEVLRGTDTPPRIFVTSYGIIYDGHVTTEIRYEKGKEYLLLLKRQIGPNDVGYGATYTNFTQEADAVIPLDDNGDPDIANSLYCKGKLTSYITDEKLIDATENGRFIEGFLSMVENNPLVFKGVSGAFIDSDDINTIVKNTPYILSAKIDFALSPSIGGHDRDVNRGIITKCTVEKIYKGEKEDIKESICVDLPKQFVEEYQGESFLILLNSLKDSGTFTGADFELSSRHSIWYFDSEEATDILKTIE